MSIFPAEGVRFLAELAANNNREWFSAHRSEFEEFVNKPSHEFFAGFKKQLASSLGTEMDGKLYRIYRDVRFSKEKTPYSPHVRFSVWEENTDPKTDCCFHTSIEPDRQVIGVGIWAFSPERLQRFRDQVESGGLDKMLERLGPIRLSEPEFKRIPKDVNGKSDHFRRKGLTLWKDIPWNGGDIELAAWNDASQSLHIAFKWLLTI